MQSILPVITHHPESVAIGLQLLEPVAGNVSPLQLAYGSRRVEQNALGENDDCFVALVS